MNNYDPDKMSLEQLKRLDMRRVPHSFEEQGAMHASVDHKLLDSYGEQVRRDMIRDDDEPYRIGMGGYWSNYQNRVCREENADPQNLVNDVKYASDVFDFDEEKRALLRNLEPVGLQPLARVTRWK